MAPSLDSANFSAPPHILEVEGVLTDFDGTIIDSTDAIVKHWHKIGKQLGVDPNVILATSHGRRSVDTLALYDPSLATPEYVSHIEGLIPKEFGQDAVEIPGARALLAQLDEVSAPWMIVTSGTRALVTGWLDVMKMPYLSLMVTAEDVSAGKPDPQCYLLGRDRLQLEGKEGKEGKDGGKGRCVVFEDAPAGVRAGKAAGFVVVGLATTHKLEQLREAGADWIVRDMRSVTVEGYEKGTGVVRIKVVDALVV